MSWAGLIRSALVGCGKELDFCSRSREKALRVWEGNQSCVFKRDQRVWGRGQGAVVLCCRTGGRGR